MSQIRYIALTLFFVPPLLLLTALDFEGKPDPVILIDQVPLDFCKSGFSGETCLAMCLGTHGHVTSPDDIFAQSGVNPALGRGCDSGELLSAARNLGLRVESINCAFDATQRWSKVSGYWKQVLRDLKQGLPSIVHLKSKNGDGFQLVVGFDPNTDQVILRQPDDGNTSIRLDRQVFLNRWAIDEADDRYAVFCMCVKGFEDQPVLVRSRFTDADFAQHVRQLKQKLPSDDFHIVIQKPFVVIGDENPSVVKRRAEDTVKWAVDRLKRDFFSKDPNHIIDIWLFKDKNSYEAHTRQLFGAKPHTPFGFYSSTEKSLIMNISTGGGTLVHEIVHPFIESNFPECPAWFNEGLASLYEQCRDKDGRIWGSTNWRLRGLQFTIKDELLPSFKNLCETSTREFYDEDPGSNYGQARYLCYYLQEQDKLVDFYRAFRENIESDRSGYKTLVQTLGEPDMDEFQKQWAQFVMGLRFPE